MKVQSYKDLTVWKKSMEFVTDVYRVTDNFPPSERYGLTSQIRRPSVSIPANIAEGSGRGTRKEYAHFVHIAYGSISETETLLEIARNLEYIDDVQYKHLASTLDEIARMTRVMRKSLHTIKDGK